MFLPKSVTHGIYALCYLSRQEQDSVASSTEIAKAVTVPAEYASKILQSLAAAGLVRSVRGRAGGYTIARDLDRITVLQVLDAVYSPGDDSVLQPRVCPVSAPEPCRVHGGLVRLEEHLLGILANQTLAQIIGLDCRDLHGNEQTAAGTPRGDLRSSPDNAALGR